MLIYVDVEDRVEKIEPKPIQWRFLSRKMLYARRLEPAELFRNENHEVLAAIIRVRRQMLGEPSI